MSRRLTVASAVASAVVVVLVVTVAAACSSGSAGPRAASTSSSRTSSTSSTSAQRFVPAPLAWRDCDQGACATLEVPLDHADPAGERIALAVVRASTADPARRIGSLLVNPGGPGAPGTDFAADAADLFPAAVRDRFDIVGWDPRGTGRSSAVDCGNRLDYLFDVDSAPDDRAELDALEASAARFARDCADRSARLLPRISSIETVRDMDLLREALGDDQLTYAGFSYGTYLGALYAQEFPDRVRALVLDGAVDPSVPAEEVGIEQAQGFARSLQAFFDDCAARTSCAFRNGGDPRRAYEALRARIDAEPLRGDGGRLLGPTQLDIAVAAPLYAGKPAYADLASALRSAERGDPDPLLREFDSYVGRRDDGTYDTEWAAFLAISCADGPNLDVKAYEAVQARAAIASRDFGAENAGLGYACSYWPVRAVRSESAPVSAPEAPPIVVIGTTGDPATPIAWAESLAAQLGSGRFVAAEGSGHTSLLDGGACLTAMATSYLVDLVAPETGTRCPG